MHFKIDRILTPVLDTVGLSKIFSYNQDESDKEDEDVPSEKHSENENEDI